MHMASAVPPTDPSVLWSATKGHDLVKMKISPHPSGVELQFEINGGWVWSQLFRPTEYVEMQELADQERRRHEAAGWEF